MKLRVLARRLRRAGRATRPSGEPAPTPGQMTRHDFLRELHVVLDPRTYLEIGVNDGRSLALSNATSIAVDPAFRITAAIRCDLELVRMTSDDFFALDDPFAHYRSASPKVSEHAADGDRSRGGPDGAHLDLAFIDGMHLFEFALRDLINVERHSEWYSVVVLDDMLPRIVDEAARDRHTRNWTGDVFKLIQILDRYRPDLTVIPVDTAPTGMAVVLGADGSKTILADRYQEILSEWLLPDPQLVPRSILDRRDAVAPDVLLASKLWAELVRARQASAPESVGRSLLGRFADLRLGGMPAGRP